MQPRKPGPTKTKFTKESANPLAFAELCYHLNNGEYSRQELLKLTGIADSTLRKWLRYLRRKEKKLVYICERRRTSKYGACLLIYAWGFEQKDVPVVRKTQAEYDRKSAVNKSLKRLYGTSSCNG
jgi:transcription initiation factor IIE alpha subunit